MSNESKKKYWIGFDLGGTKMMAVVFDKDFKALSRVRKKTKANEGMVAGVERMGDVIDEALVEAKLTKKNITGIGVGCPGPLDLNRGVIIYGPNLGWKNAKIKASLEKRFGCPAMISNDVDAGVYGEYCYGAGRGARCVLGVFPGTGIGAGCIYEGRILRGKVNSCMELGHIQVLPNGPLCGCGQHGCLESVASRLAISTAAAAAAYRGEAPYLLKSVGMDLSNISSGKIAAAIDAGDKAVERIVRDAAKWLGIGIANAINLLAPDVVILGGGLVEALPKMLITEIEETSRKKVMTAFKDTYTIKLAQLGDNATATGAAAWVRESVNK